MVDTTHTTATATNRLKYLFPTNGTDSLSATDKALSGRVSQTLHRLRELPDGITEMCAGAEEDERDRRRARGVAIRHR